MLTYYEYNSVRCFALEYTTGTRWEKMKMVRDHFEDKGFDAGKIKAAIKEHYDMRKRIKKFNNSMNTKSFGTITISESRK